MREYCAAVRGDYNHASIISLVLRRRGLGVIVVMMELVAVQVVREQCPDMYVAVPRLPASIVMIEHGSETWQQRNRCGGCYPADPRSHTPDGRQSHD